MGSNRQLHPGATIASTQIYAQLCDDNLPISFQLPTPNQLHHVPYTASAAAVLYLLSKQTPLPIICRVSPVVWNYWPLTSGGWVVRPSLARIAEAPVCPTKTLHAHHALIRSFAWDTYSSGPQYPQRIISRHTTACVCKGTYQDWCMRRLFRVLP